MKRFVNHKERSQLSVRHLIVIGVEREGTIEIIGLYTSSIGVYLHSDRDHKCPLLSASTEFRCSEIRMIIDLTNGLTVAERSTKQRLASVTRNSVGTHPLLR